MNANAPFSLFCFAASGNFGILIFFAGASAVAWWYWSLNVCVEVAVSGAFVFVLSLDSDAKVAVGVTGDEESHAVTDIEAAATSTKLAIFRVSISTLRNHQDAVVSVILCPAVKDWESFAQICG